MIHQYFGEEFPSNQAKAHNENSIDKRLTLRSTCKKKKISYGGFYSHV